jgi:acetyl esterase/lipase
MPTNQTIYLWPDGSPHNDVPSGTMDGSKFSWGTMIERPRIEMYPPAQKARSGGKGRGCVLVCPGGGYQGLARHEGEPFAELFSSLGLLSGVVYYRVSPNRFPAPYADACRAMRLMRAKADELDIDPSRVALMGFSAGGHLASTVATQPNLYSEPQDDLATKLSARPDRVILGYPVISMVTRYHAGSATNLLGAEPSEELRIKFSNELHVTKSNPPAFIFHTADDEAVPVENALMFASAYAREKVPCELHSYRSGPHGVGLAANSPALKSWGGLLTDWLSDWVKGE